MAGDLPSAPVSARPFPRPGAGSAGEVIALGTCAWNFDDWRDVFYPDGLAGDQQLTYYSTYLRAVEVDSTFYSAPRPEVAASWKAKTPEDFVFLAKVPRAITHEARLRDCAGELAALVESLTPLGAKLGALLIQLPPSFRPQTDEDALRGFLEQLPTGAGAPRFAVEFRHADWRRRRFTRLLEKHRVAWAWQDVSAPEDSAAAPFEVLPQTADFLFLRLAGDISRKFRADVERQYRYGSLLWPRDQALEGWAHRLGRHLEDCQRIFVMAGNHYEGFAPLTCQRLGKLLGIPIELPSLVTHAGTPGEAPAERDEQMPLL